MNRTTISIREETKSLLEELKGDKSWDEFFMEVARMLRRERKKEALTRLRALVSDEDLEYLEKNLSEVRVRWKFKG
mgnify:CR=1 FL=1